MSAGHTPGAPLPPPNFAALADALYERRATLLPQWLPGIKLVNGEWQCGSLAGEEGQSLRINDAKGVWSDFASGDTGRDLLDLYAAQRNLGKTAAAVELANDLALWDVAGTVRPKAQGGAAAHSLPPPPPPKPAPAPVREDEGWQVVAPVPEHAEKPTFRHQHRTESDRVHTARYEYEGQLYGYVVRFRTSDGGKDTLPYTWCRSARDGGARWHWKTWAEPRPLYFPGGKAPDGRTVVLVEGERKAEVLSALLALGAPGVYCVASWAGGCKVWSKAQWSWLAGSTVLLWPDCDAKRKKLPVAERKALLDNPDALAAAEAAQPLLPEHKQPGMAAMLGIGRLLAAEHGCTVALLPIPKPGAVADGWDCADAIEGDQWSYPMLMGVFGQAQPLPEPVADDEAAGSGKGPDGEKIKGPVTTAEANSAGGGGDGSPPAAGGGDGSDDGGEKLPWWLKPYFVAKRWMVSRRLVIDALKHHPLLCDVLAFDELNNEPRARKDWPWVHGAAGPLNDATDLRLGNWLSETYKVSAISRASLIEAITTVADSRRYHPIREWLGGLQWDGKPRIDKWLIHALGHKPEELPASQAEYLQLVGRFWLIGMVARVMRPGCKFDYMPVLEGSGGLRKSTLPKVLAGEDWFSDSLLQIERGKESYEQVQGRWIYEIAELAGMSRVDVNLIKGFIASTDDRYRGAYGRTVQSHPRQVVFVGTTNERAYLRDRTGNRRFWPIAVTKPINTEWVSRWREQLFAEALQLFQAGEPYSPTREQEDRLFAPRQREREVQTAIDSELRRLLTREGSRATEDASTAITVLTNFVTLAQMVKALGVDAGKATAGQQQEIRAWFASEGWEYKKKQIDNVRQHGWERPADWPREEVAADDEPPQAAAETEGADGLPL